MTNTPKGKMGKGYTQVIYTHTQKIPMAKKYCEIFQFNSNQIDVIKAAVTNPL